MLSYSEFCNDEFNIKETLMFFYYESLSNEDKEELHKFSLKRYMVNENVVNTLSAKGKQVLSNICNSVNSVVHFLEKIKKELYQHLSVILSSTKDKIKSKLAGDKDFIKSVKKQINIDKNAFVQDVKTCKDISSFYTSKFTESILKSVFTSLRNLIVHKKHDILKEGLNINVIDSVVQHLHKLPPFSWLDMLHHKGSHGASHLIHGLSYLTKKLGGPEFKLPVIASLLGLAFEYNIKGLVKHGLIDAAEIFSIPFVGIVVKTAGNVATFLACYELFKEISASVDSFQHYDHDTKDHHTDNKGAHNKGTGVHKTTINRFNRNTGRTSRNIS